VEESRSLADLFALVNDLERGCQIQDSARWRSPTAQHPDGYFHFPCSFRKGDQVVTYRSGISIDFPAKCTQCIVRVSAEWIAKHPGQWTREISLSLSPCGRRLGEGHAIYWFSKQVSHSGTSAILRGEIPVLFEITDLHEL
jgi:hypothetical protein